MFKITVKCIGVPSDAGPGGEVDIEQEFREHRPWWGQPQCIYADVEYH
jgi:hypothetical protein